MTGMLCGIRWVWTIQVYRVRQLVQSFPTTFRLELDPCPIAPIRDAGAV